MVYVLRAVGWLLFATGAVVFIALGGFTAAREGNYLAMGAGIMMPIGMFITATCTMMTNWKSIRGRPDQAEQMTAEAMAPPPAGAPAKQYKARKLVDQKLSSEVQQRVEEEKERPPTA